MQCFVTIGTQQQNQLARTTRKAIVLSDKKIDQLNNQLIIVQLLNTTTKIDKKIKTLEQ
jgi:hypothetical protein